ncbi:hypothetical protein L3Y34_014015 [Caenorhabditis briggsae]|uniref:Uncharacterized protein n=1 Tax=Caenorhabditis briggsae TaxID=6238 RepID=A0AAE9IWY0_CAEBR|nr:hypothetical protein L3Y34_014015 [Caenorhabditis briggsae]
MNRFLVNMFVKCCEDYPCFCRKKQNQNSLEKVHSTSVYPLSSGDSMSASGKCSKMRPRFEMLKSMSYQNSIDVTNNEMYTVKI